MPKLKILGSQINKQINTFFLSFWRDLCGVLPCKSCKVLHQSHGHGAQKQSRLWSWLSSYVTAAKSPPDHHPQASWPHTGQKCPPQHSPYSSLTNLLMPAFQQEFSRSWGYKNWLLIHEKCRLSLVQQEVGLLHCSALVIFAPCS